MDEDRTEIILALTRRLADGAEAGDWTVWEQALPEVQALSVQGRRNLITLVAYELDYREARRAVRSASHRRAWKLLRSFLSQAQNERLTRHKSFLVRGSAGRIYQILPHMGNVFMVERHGKSWRWLVRYCLHDYPESAPDKKRLPSPDLSLQHLLLLQCDEPAFLATANATPNRWIVQNGRWAAELRHLHKSEEQQDAEIRQQQLAATNHQPSIRLCLDTDVAA